MPHILSLNADASGIRWANEGDPLNNPSPEHVGIKPTNLDTIGGRNPIPNHRLDGAKTL